jgi:hypothetical protein
MKDKFFRSFNAAVKERLPDGRIKLTGIRNNGQSLVVIYRDFGFVDEVEIYRTDCIGRKYTQSTCDNNGRLAIKRAGDHGSTTISVNELIYQFDRLTKGLQVVQGEYNHFVRISDRDEEFSAMAGDVCTQEQNKIHLLLTNRIKNETGLVCRVPSYGNVYSLIGKNKITIPMINQYVNIGDIQIVTDRLK